MQYRKRALLVSLAALSLATPLGCDSGTPSATDDAGMIEPPDAAMLVVDDARPADDAFSGPPDAFNASVGETGRMVGMTEAHNYFRRMVATDTPVPALVWDADIAAVAQAYSEELAANGCGLSHSSNGYGENLYWQRGLTVTPMDVVDGWHGEIACYTYGPFMRGDSCDMACTSAMNASGCGHYTQVVWRETRRLGRGMARCSSGAEIWTCNYDPPGNYLGRNPY